MRLLTPELQCISALQVTAIAGVAVATRELDFNLSRRSGVLINQVVSSYILTLALGVAANTYAQELDLDPDNVTIWQNNSTPDAVEYDSSRLVRHVEGGTINVATDNTFVDNPRSILIKQWHDVPLERRPISITSMRHHLWMGANLADSVLNGQLVIYYHIIELTLEELGILNASRR